VVDASIDQAGHVGVGLVLFNTNKHLQLVHFVPSMIETTFQAEAEAVYLALRDWGLSFLQKSEIIYTNCQSLVKYLERGDIT
jgi:hypothetical protein